MDIEHHENPETELVSDPVTQNEHRVPSGFVVYTHRTLPVAAATRMDESDEHRPLALAGDGGFFTLLAEMVIICSLEMGVDDLWITPRNA